MVVCLKAIEDEERGERKGKMMTRKRERKKEKKEKKRKALVVVASARARNFVDFPFSDCQMPTTATGRGNFNMSTLT